MAVTDAPKKVAIIIGSTRVKRVGPDVAKFIFEFVSVAEPSISFSIVDVADFKLPNFDEEFLPATVPTYGGKYIQDHTIAWSKEISSFDGYIFITPEYNAGPPGAVKNAIDFLYNEWKGKPLLLVAYGIMGGSAASTALNTTFKGMYVDIVETRPLLAFPGDDQPASSRKSVRSATTGILTKETLEAWSGKEKTEILKGVEELKAKLLAPPKAA